jgi:hypothetical protein
MLFVSGNTEIAGSAGLIQKEKSHISVNTSRGYFVRNERRVFVMNDHSPRVLLIQEQASGTSHMTNWLTNHGCQCHFAASFKEAADLVLRENFDLVLSTVRPETRTISALAILLKGSHTEFFYAYPVEDGCWWLPAVRSGDLASGSPALRPSEFISVLDAILPHMRQREAFSAAKSSHTLK